MIEIEKLNDKRKELGLSVEELAQRAELPKSTVEKVLFGVVKHPRIDTVQAIERALGIAEEPTTALTANESFIQEYGSLFEDNVFRRYTRVFYLLNGEQRLYILGYVIGVAERYGIKAEEVM